MQTASHHETDLRNKQKVQFLDWGLTDYEKAWKQQDALHASLVERKLANRNLPDNQHIPQNHYLVFCEHPHVYTLGRSGREEHLLLDDAALKSIDAVFYRNNRGGDITYHGPGQIVGYPILDLDCFFTDIHKYLRLLEEAVIRTLAGYSITAGRIDKLTGVWIDAENPNRARKICAFGVRCSRWVTMHGFALNVNTNLDYFNNIIPCGISDKQVTSMQKESGIEYPLDEVKEKLKYHLQDLFNIQLVE